MDRDDIKSMLFSALFFGFVGGLFLFFAAFFGAIGVRAANGLVDFIFGPSSSIDSTSNF